jgi:hypothetical protein
MKLKITGSIVLFLVVCVAIVVLFRIKKEQELHRPSETVVQPTSLSPTAPVQPVASQIVERINVEPATNIVSSDNRLSTPPPSQELEFLMPFTDMSVRIRNVVQPDSSLTPQLEYQRRIKAVHDLDDHLTSEEIQVLIAFLRSPIAADTSLDLLSINSIKNEVMDLLIQQEPVPQDLGKELALMADDSSLDSGLRDYCVQHFAPYFKARWGSGEVDPESPDYQAIMLGYDQAVRLTNTSLPGTALIGLYSLSEDYQAVDRQNVEKLAFQMGNDPGTFVNTRVTAIQICGRMGLKEILPTARIEAQSGESIQLRMSAIATLGDLGEKDDAALIEALSLEKDSRIQTAAQSALKRLNRRLEATPK